MLYGCRRTLWLGRGGRFCCLSQVVVVVVVMATYVSELEAAKKSLSEALGENVKQ